ncbi:hypothetical protein Trydic_g6525 [Trypoxylus dichotomus]
MEAKRKVMYLITERDITRVTPSRVGPCLDAVGLHVARRGVPLPERRGSISCGSPRASYGIELCGSVWSSDLRDAKYKFSFLFQDSLSTAEEKLRGQAPKETIHFFPGAKNPMLYYDNFLYKVVRKMTDSTTWICVAYGSKRCRALIRTSKEGILVINLTHNHAPVIKDVSVFHFFPGPKNLMLYYENYLYRIHKRTSRHISWRCRGYDRFKCKAQIKTSKGIAELTRRWHTHIGVEMDLSESVESHVLFLKKNE